MFSGWYTDTARTGPFDSLAAYSYPKDITLYAKWTETATDHTVTFNSDGGTPVAPYVGRGFISPVPATTKPGYTFLSWRYYNGSLGWENFDFEHCKIGMDYYLKAFWQIKTNTVSFDSGGGSAVSPITANYDTAITKPADPTRDGFTFGGWYTDRALTNEFTAWKMPADSLTLYAKWTAAAGGVTYYVQYYTQILDEIGTTYALYRTDTLSAAADTSVTVQPEALSGFTYNESAENVTSGTASEGLTLKLYYTRNRYNLTTNTGLEGATAYTISALYGATLSSYLAAPTCDGKVFAGWFDSSGT